MVCGVVGGIHKIRSRRISNNLLTVRAADVLHTAYLFKIGLVLDIELKVSCAQFVRILLCRVRGLQLVVFRV